MIYVLQAGDDGPFKIGYTARRSEIRRQACQTYNSEEIRIIADAPGDEALEGRLHLYLKDYRIRGEWFRNEGLVREVVEAIQQGISIRDLLDCAE